MTPKCQVQPDADGLAHGAQPLEQPWAGRGGELPPGCHWQGGWTLWQFLTHCFPQWLLSDGCCRCWWTDPSSLVRTMSTTISLIVSGPNSILSKETHSSESLSFWKFHHSFSLSGILPVAYFFYNSLQKLTSSKYRMFLSMESFVEQLSSHLHLTQQHLCLWRSLLWPVLSIQARDRQTYWMLLALQIPTILACKVGCPCPLPDVLRGRPPLVCEHRPGQGGGGAHLSFWVDGQRAWRSSWTVPRILLFRPFWFSFCRTSHHICQAFSVEYQTLMLNYIKQLIQYFVRFWSFV